MSNEVWFYCKVNPTVLTACSWHSMGCGGTIYPNLWINDNSYIAVYKDGFTEKMMISTEENELLPKNIRLRFDKNTGTLYDDVYSMFSRGKIAFKIIEYSSDTRKCYIPKATSLLEEYKLLKLKIKKMKNEFYK